MEDNYIITRKKNKAKMTKKYFGENGYELSFKKNINDGIKVNKVVIFDDEFINKSINKRIKKKFKNLLELVVEIMENDEDPSNGLMVALNETEKFKRELINKYNRYLIKEERDFNDKKIKAIENEVKNRLYEYQMINELQKKVREQMYVMGIKEEVEEKEVRRSR